MLHTWSQTLLDHYHLHCIVTGGGLHPDRPEWRPVKKHWLFPVRALSVVFRAKFRDGLRALFDAGQLEFHGQLQPLAQRHPFERLLRTATRQKWVVYAKRPFPGAEAVLAYLSRYTHRVGLTNRRLRALDRERQTVTLDYKDYADESRHKLMTLGWDEFIRRFRLHLLPPRFVKIRHYGLLGNRHRHARMAQVRAVLHVETDPSPPPDPILATKAVVPLPICPFCAQPALRLMRVIHRSPGRAPPALLDTS